MAESNPPKQDPARDLVEALWQMNERATHDLCGEQREFYLSRLRKAFTAAGTLFPYHLIGVVARANPDMWK